MKDCTWGVASLRDDVLPGPFPEGAGLPGSAIQESARDFLGTGSRKLFGASLLPTPWCSRECLRCTYQRLFEDRSSQIHGVLCVDRLKKDCWSAEDKTALEMLARKVSLDVATVSA